MFTLDLQCNVKHDDRHLPFIFLLVDSQHCIILPMLIGEINIVAPTVDGKQIMLQRLIYLTTNYICIAGRTGCFPSTVGTLI